MNSDILAGVKKMYDESGVYFSQTRRKSYLGGSNNWPVTQKYLDKLTPGMSVLDVGCGNGRLVSGLPDKIDYTGFDFSETLLAEARKRYPERDFFLRDAVYESSWRTLGKYDAIFCVAVIHHLPERKQQLFVLKKMREHCQDNGLLFLSVWNLWQERFAQAHLDSLDLKKINPRFVKVPFDKKWTRFCVQMDIPYLIELFEEARLKIDEIFYADRAGKKATIETGENLIVVAKKN